MNTRSEITTVSRVFLSHQTAKPASIYVQVMNVVVLAAGKGVACGPSPRTDQSRCYQSEIDRDHIVTELERRPVTEVILVVGSNRERAQTYFEDGRDGALDITYVT